VLIDTNVWSELARPRPDPVVQKWFRENLESCFLSSIVFGEIQYGIALAEGTRRQDLQSFLDDLLVRLPNGIVDFDGSAAIAWGPLRAHLKRTGQLIGERDMLIAAHALALDIPLVTRNVSDMARTGAVIINPWEP
jgi:predicted nucleic acid-binding protein